MSAALSAAEPPKEWIEPATGHRVVRLSQEPGTSSFYFHQNGYTASGDKLVVGTRDGLAAIDLGTRANSLVVTGRAGNFIVGGKTRQVFYTRGGSIFATHLDTRATREIAKLPSEIRDGSGFALNADETLLAGSYVSGPRPTNAPARSGGQEGSLETRWAQHLPMRLYTVNVRSGDLNTFHADTNWLNHVQFSPGDPGLLMFCHEGPWHKVDRIWTIRAGADRARLMHPRTMEYEIAGHEFFSHDGQCVWYDLQTPRSKVFWLAGVNVATGERIRYPIERGHWSVHYNISRDGKLFAGDGGGPNSVANLTPLPERRPLDPPGNGPWICLFKPRPGGFETITVGGEKVSVGRLDAERLVDLSKHDYRLEPNVTFTPNGKWIVFRSNLHGATHTYAVELAKAR